MNKKNSFDLICGFQSIYYNLNLNKFINSEVYNILKPGGKFIFSFFANDHSYMKYISRYRDNIYYFNNLHPNKRLHGSKFYFVKSKKNLISCFKSFKKKKIFETKSNQTIFKEARFRRSKTCTTTPPNNPKKYKTGVNICRGRRFLTMGGLFFA